MIRQLTKISLFLPPAMLVALAIACGGGSDDSTKVDPNVPLPKVGEVVKTKNFEIKVTFVKDRRSVGGRYLNQKASQGATFVTIVYEYKNISGKPLSSYKLPKSPKLISPDGVKYDKDSQATIYYSTQIKIDEKVLSDLNPGITSKGAAAFEVAIDSWKQKGWRLKLDADDDILIQLNE